MIQNFSYRELEYRLMPNAYSSMGFLGPEESLEEVLRYDAVILQMLDITYDQIADSLAEFVDRAFEGDSYWGKDDRLLQLFRFPQKANTFFHLSTLPSEDIGYIKNNLQIFALGYKGIQDCPWDCKDIEILGSYDFILLDRETGEYIFGPSLIVHLIRKHHFFEGLESPYRVDPEKLVRILGL